MPLSKSGYSTWPTHCQQKGRDNREAGRENTARVVTPPPIRTETTKVIQKKTYPKLTPELMQKHLLYLDSCGYSCLVAKFLKSVGYAVAIWKDSVLRVRVNPNPAEEIPLGFGNLIPKKTDRAA